jgi:hypothetical protein
MLSVTPRSLRRQEEIMESLSSFNEWFSHFWPLLALIAAALVLTFWVFRRRKFERGYRKGEAKNPEEVRRENAPDRWSRSH